MASLSNSRLALECFYEAGQHGLAQYSTGSGLSYFVALSPGDWQSLWTSPYCRDIQVLHDGSDWTPKGKEFLSQYRSHIQEAK